MPVHALHLRVRHVDAYRRYVWCMSPQHECVDGSRQDVEELVGEMKDAVVVHDEAQLLVLQRRVSAGHLCGHLYRHVRRYVEDMCLDIRMDMCMMSLRIADEDGLMWSWHSWVRLFWSHGCINCFGFARLMCYGACCINELWHNAHLSTCTRRHKWACTCRAQVGTHTQLLVLVTKVLITDKGKRYYS